MNTNRNIAMLLLIIMSTTLNGMHNSPSSGHMTDQDIQMFGIGLTTGAILGAGCYAAYSWYTDETDNIKEKLKKIEINLRDQKGLIKKLQVNQNDEVVRMNHTRTVMLQNTELSFIILGKVVTLSQEETNLRRQIEQLAVHQHTTQEWKDGMQTWQNNTNDILETLADQQERMENLTDKLLGITYTSATNSSQTE